MKYLKINVLVITICFLLSACSNGHSSSNMLNKLFESDGDNRQIKVSNDGGISINNEIQYAVNMLFNVIKCIPADIETLLQVRVQNLMECLEKRQNSKRSYAHSW